MKDPFKTNGAVSWTELCTNEPEKAKKFYGDLFGWKYEEMPMPTGEGTYNVITAGGITFGGIMKTPEKYKEMPPMWGSYVTVEDVEKTAKKVVELGGKILTPPTDIPGTGSFICIQDPTGAIIMAITYEEM